MQLDGGQPQTTSGCKSQTQRFSSAPRMLADLPFANYEIEDAPAAELLGKGHLTYTYPRDGVVDFHSIRICSSNAKALAKFLRLSMGLSEVAYKGLETGNHFIASHVLTNGRFTVEISSALRGHEESSTMMMQGVPAAETLKMIDCEVDAFAAKFPHFDIDVTIVKDLISAKCSTASDQSLAAAHRLTLERLELIKLQNFLTRHGDGVIDVSLVVLDCVNAFEKAVRGGAIPVRTPHIATDAHGSVHIAVVGVPGTDFQHSLVQNLDYTGSFLPNYRVGPSELSPGYNSFLQSLPAIGIVCLDHSVENYTWNQMMGCAEFYATAFGFHRYWSVDEQDVFTGNSSLKSIVMASSNGKVKIPINEPGEGKKRGQIEEFYDFNEGPGIQHLALRTHDIITTVRALMQRGLEFNTMSERYYADLARRLQHDDVRLIEDLAVLRTLNILVDYDPSTRNRKTKVCHYILQIFTKPFSDRPTLFLEIIQRRHHNGFGKGTFKGLFETIEAQQILRGTLTDRHT